MSNDDDGDGRCGGTAEDKQLLAAWVNGDRSAGARLFDRHHTGVARLLLNKISNQRDNDDLVQQSFLDLLEYAKQYRGDASVRTLLFLIARRKLYAHYRRQSRDRQRFDPLETSVAALDTSPSQAVAAREQRGLLNRALRELPLETQVIIELYYWQEVQLEDIAVIIEQPPGTIRSKLHRGRIKLRAELERLAESPEALEHTLSSLSQWAERVHGQLDDLRDDD